MNHTPVHEGGIGADPRLQEGLDCFEDQQFFEAHEVWESLWHGIPKAHPERIIVQGLIQLAVSLEHWRRGNPRGARGQWEKARAKLDGVGARWGLQIPETLVATAAFYAPWVDAEAQQARGAWTPPPNPVWPALRRSG